MMLAFTSPTPVPGGGPLAKIGKESSNPAMRRIRIERISSPLQE